MQLLNIHYLGLTAVAAALVLAGCGGGASPQPNNTGPFTVDGEIESSDFFDRNDNRHYDIFLLRAERSGRAEIAMSSFDLDSQIFVYRDRGDDDFGSPIAEDDDSGDGPDAVVSFDVQRGVNYRVIATSSRENEFGDYQIFFSREFGRPGILLPRQNARTSSTFDLPAIKAKGAPKKRSQQ